MNTSELIERLAEGAEPVQPLPSPGRRTVAWLIGAGAYVAVLIVTMSAPGAAVVDTRLLVPQIAAVLTGILAAAAAFASIVPGHSKRLVVWPPIMLLIWLGTFLIGSAEGEPASVLGARHEWFCVGLIIVGGAPLLVALAVLLRRGAPLNPAMTAAFAAIAVGALANVGACASQPHADNAATLVWHGSAVLALVLAFVGIARFVFTWRRA